MAEAAVKYKIVGLGGSAGSLNVILKIINALPHNANVIVVIIIHRKTSNDSILEDLVSSRTSIPTREVEDKDPIEPNTIYIAPPDYHLLIENENEFSLDSSEKIHFSRPSIDVTFESMAETFGASCIGVLLSGANADGCEGLKSIKRKGGLSLVQNPLSAESGFMPQHAINQKAMNRIVDADELPLLIADLLK
jgi:two-component system, chemotaxis family, protein-glutamate methylesterase/glutaminase